jgi:uncharacterized RDD family membrane protein YckC
VSTDAGPERDIRLQGHYAGIVTRLAAFLVDAFAVVVLYALGGQGLEFLISSVGGDEFTFREHPLVASTGLVIWAFVYFAYPLAVSGRTFGMALLGLRAVRRDGSDLDARHAVIRVVAFPLSLLLFGFGFLLILLKRDRRALHDVIAKTAIVYSWDARAARLRFLAKRGSG